MEFLDLVGLVLGALGILVPVAAALYEFVLFGRRRLGYRVQMDTPVTDDLQLNLAGPLQRMKIDNRDLDHPSVVLLRIENAGSAEIRSDDYATLPGDPVGLRVVFPQRRVCGIAVTEFNDGDGHLRNCFGENSGLGIANSSIKLPRVPLNRGDHYKVLVVLERESPEESAPPAAPEPPKPRVEGGVMGAVRRANSRGRLRETESNTTGLPRRWAVAVFAFVFLVSASQIALALTQDEVGAPLDCEEGVLTLVGSTAFRPVLEAAEHAYEDRCGGEAVVDIRVEAESSDEGLHRLDAAGDDRGGDVPDMLAFSDGEKADTYTQLLQRPIALVLFTLVADDSVGLADLSPRQIEGIWRGDITRWDDDRLDGADLDIRSISRESNSGTQRMFRDRVLGGDWVEEETSEDCVNDDAGAGHINCRVGSTGEMLDRVASLDGAIGYAELNAVLARDGVKTLSIGGWEASLNNAEAGGYPFWATEYAYSYGELDPESLASSFLRFLTEQIGKDIIRAEGHRPCDDMDNERLCRPEAAGTRANTGTGTDR